MSRRVLHLTLLAAVVNGFVVVNSGNIRQPVHPLNLLPTQGQQLVAAFNAACEGKHCDHSSGTANKKESQDCSCGQQDQQHQGRLKLARDFCLRVFSLPSSLIQRHPHPRLEGFLEDNDVVYYPLIGFKFVGESNRALPTCGHPSCRLRPVNQDLYGWYSPACRIDLNDEGDTY